MQAIAFFEQILRERIPTDVFESLRSQAQALHDEFNQRSFFIAFSSIIRRCGKDALQLNAEEYLAATTVCSDWRPQHWRVDHAARIYLLLHAPQQDADQFCQLLDRLFQAADLGESEALYLSLCLLPFPERHIARAQEGLRSNVLSIFQAIAQYSPYPQAQFDEGSWNQMVLKSLFVESELHPIVGLDQRSNPQLTRMLCDYAHERWAASRSISPELWRCVGACPNPESISDLERALKDGNEQEQAAVGLSIKDSSMPEAQALLQAYPQVHQKLTQGLCWQDILANP